MPHPCPRHSSPAPDTCRLCWLLAHVRHFQRLYGLPETGEFENTPRLPVSSAKKNDPCIYFGKQTGDSVDCPTCTGKVSLKLFACDLFGECTPVKPAPGVACCKGCESKVTLKSRIEVPIPPFLELAPDKRYAVVTVATGKRGRDMLDISGPSLRAYADRLNADFVVLDWPGLPQYPITAKFQIPRVLEFYERVIYLDADIIVQPAAPDLFEMVAPDEFGIYNELAESLGYGGSLMTEYQETRISQGLERSPIEFYGNAGVMVFGEAHRNVLTIPPNPMPPIYCVEQHWWNARLHDCKVKMHLLPKIANWQWWPKKSLEGAPPNAILHFSGMDQFAPGKRIELMRRFASQSGKSLSSA